MLRRRRALGCGTGDVQMYGNSGVGAPGGGADRGARLTLRNVARAEGVAIATGRWSGKRARRRCYEGSAGNLGSPRGVAPVTRPKTPFPRLLSPTRVRGPSICRDAFLRRRRRGARKLVRVDYVFSTGRTIFGGGGTATGGSATYRGIGLTTGR